MKQQIVLIGLVFAVLTAFSQTNNSTTSTASAAPADTAKAPKDYCPHRIWVDFGAAWTNNMYKRFNKFEPKTLDQKHSVSTRLEVGYAYFFHPNMGVGLGVGVSRLGAKAALGTKGLIPDVADPNYIPDGVTVPDSAKAYDVLIRTNGLVERQEIWAIEVPLTFQFEKYLGKNQRNGIFASLGVKGYFAIPNARTHFTGGVLSRGGKDDYVNVEWPVGMPVHFEDVKMDKFDAKAKMRSSVDIIGNVGGLIGLTKRVDLYLGAWASYGFLDILPKERADVYYLDIASNQVNGILNSNTLDKYSEKYPDVKVNTKWNLLQIGVKVGFRIKTCGQHKQSFYEDKRDFLDKYGDRLDKKGNDEPKKNKEDDGKKGKGEGEAVYIMPIFVGNGNGGFNRVDDGDIPGDMSPAERDLVKSLTNAQIYFDLDKDTPLNPKLANSEVEKAVTILKNNPDIRIVIDGYTCRLGTQPHNVDLAQRRANTIRNMFIAKGVNPNQVTTEAFTVANYPLEVSKSFQTLEDARTVIFRIERIKK